MPKAPKPVVDLAAACACGAYSVSVRGPIVAMFMCSCEDCQKSTGTGHATVALAATGDVTVTPGAKSFARPAHSGAILTRWFCPVCGTPLHAASSRAVGLVMLPVGLFGAETAWYVPSQLIFARSHRDWDTIAAGLPRHATYRDEASV